MRMKKHIKLSVQIVFIMIAVILLASPSFAAVFNLRADETTVTMPDGAIIPMWGFALDAGPVTVPGPFLVMPPGDTTLTINLTNDLSEPISIVIPGLPAPLSPETFIDAQGRQRVSSFTTVTPAGGVNTYTWNNVRPGTYIYHSGTHISLQVHMGLYGGMKVDSAAGEAYPGVTYDNEVILFYSEIDRALHDPDAVSAQPLNYKPDYFLINGQPYPASVPILDHPITAGEQVLIRFLNMGLKTHVPSFVDGHLSVIAEDGFPYTYPKTQYSVLLPAGKTVDALWTAPASYGDYPVYDRRHFLRNAEVSPGGMLVYLSVTGTVDMPVAVDDVYSVDEDNTLTVAAPGVLGNDTGINPLSAILVSNVSNGTLTLNSDGSFTYVPNANFNGSDVFTYKANDGVMDSNVATVTITVNAVNDTPVAVNDNYNINEGQTLNVAAPGVLGNDSDIDGDTLTAHLVTGSGPTNGTLTLNTNGSFTYTPDTGFTGTDSFQYIANDGLVDSNQATVTITVNAVVNQPPVAVDDSASTRRNTPITITVLSNDYDPDGTLNPATVTVTVNPTNGTAVANSDGTIRYLPGFFFRGTDAFRYTVQDNEGAVSNEAVVTVIVR